MRSKRFFSTCTKGFLAVIIAVTAMGCAIETSPGSSRGPEPQPTAEPAGSATPHPLNPQQEARLKTVMVPLLQKMNKPIPQNQVRIGLLDDPNINAANAGGGEFYVTAGLLQKANDEQLAGVMAHEVAHADLGHVTKLQTIGAGVSIATVLLDALGVPGARLVPVAGNLFVALPYSRDAEYAADRHGVELLQRTGRDGKQIMTNTLEWLMQTAGSGGGGFFATHPGTEDRIQKIRSM